MSAHTITDLLSTDLPASDLTKIVASADETPGDSDWTC